MDEVQAPQTAAVVASLAQVQSVPTGSVPAPVPVVAPKNDFNVSTVHAALDTAEQTYHSTFAGHVPDEVHRFEQFLSTVRMIVDQSADSASKEG